MKVPLLIIAALCTFQAGAQTLFETILTDITANNPDLQVRRQGQEARQAAYNVGLTPYDPTVSFDYLAGFPRAGGDQTELTAVQAFDLPRVYRERRRLAELAGGESGYAVASYRQEILIDARRTMVELTYSNNMAVEFARRISQAEQVYRMLERKLDQGEGNILDANKARLQWLNLQNERQLLENRRRQLLTHLAMLNGGKAVAYPDTLYPPLPPLPAFDSLETYLESADPTLQHLQQQALVAEQQVAVARALLGPRLEAGYRYQGILGQRFHGLHVGFSIPLWEKRNTVRQRQLESVYVQGQIAAHRNEHFYEIRQAYERFTGLQQALAEYRELLTSTNNLPLLEKALRAGQITATEYYLDALQFYALSDKAFLLEKEVHLAAAELWRING
jgi:cobalt-zinc-cadmium efflux system outer membrane protein